MSWLTDIGYAAAFIGGGILLGWLLFQFYVYRERLDVRRHIPETYLQWSLIGAICSVILMLIVAQRSLVAAAGMWVLTAMYVGFWIQDSRGGSPATAEVADG